MSFQSQERWAAALNALHVADERQSDECERLEVLVPMVEEYLERTHRDTDRYHTLKLDKHVGILPLHKAYEDLCYSKWLVVRAYQTLRSHLRALDTAHINLIDCDRACRALFDLIPARERRSYRPVRELYPDIDTSVFKRTEALPSFWPQDRQDHAQSEWVYKHREELYTAGFSDWAIHRLGNWAREREDADRKMKDAERKMQDAERRREDAERKEKEDSKRRSREEAEIRRKEEAERKRREEAERERRRSFRRSGFAEAYAAFGREDPMDDLTGRYDRSYPREQNIPRDRQEAPKPARDRRQSFRAHRDEEGPPQPERKYSAFREETEDARNTRENRRSYVQPDYDPGPGYSRTYRSSFRAYKEGERPRERAETLRTPRGPNPTPREPEEEEFPRRRSQSYKTQPENRSQGARRRPQSYAPFDAGENEGPRPSGRDRARSFRTGSNAGGGGGGPPPKPSTARATKSELVRRWRRECEPVLQNRHALLERFPDPPGGISRCTRIECSAFAAARALGACCQHDLREIFAAVPDFDARRERLCWHPDRFSACAGAAEFQAKAKEIFHAINEMM